jgi:hypothetical protein
MKGQIDYRKTKEAFNLINGDLARLDDEFVRLMLQAKYGAGICRAIQNLERLRRCKRLPSEETNQLLGFLGIKPATSKRRSRKLEGTYPSRPEFKKFHGDQERVITARNTDGTVWQTFTKPYVTDEIRLALRAASLLNVPARMFLEPRPWGWEFVRHRVLLLAPSANPLATLEYLRSLLYILVPSKRLSGKELHADVENRYFPRSGTVRIRSVVLFSDDRAFVAFGDLERVMPIFNIKHREVVEKYSFSYGALRPGCQRGSA